MWVCVSSVFDLKKIVEKIFRSSTSSNFGNLEMDQLQNEFPKNFNKKKYLLVLNDVWNEDSENWCN